MGLKIKTYSVDIDDSKKFTDMFQRDSSRVLRNLMRNAIEFSLKNKKDCLLLKSEFKLELVNHNKDQISKKTEKQTNKAKKRTLQKYDNDVINIYNFFIETNKELNESFKEPELESIKNNWKFQLNLLLTKNKVKKEELKKIIVFAAEQTKLHLAGEVAYRVESMPTLRKKFNLLKIAFERQNNIKNKLKAETTNFNYKEIKI